MSDELPRTDRWPLRLPIITGPDGHPPITPEVREWLESVEGRLWTPTPQPDDQSDRYACKVFFHAEYEWGPSTGYQLRDVTPAEGGSAP